MLKSLMESKPSKLFFSPILVEETEKIVVLNVDKFPDLPNQLAMIQIQKRDLAIAKLIQPLIKNHLDTITVNYYSEIQKEVSLLKIIDDNSSVERLKGTLKRHLYELFDGKIDDEFIQQRHRIAEVHVHIGLQTKWYMAAFQSLFSTFVDIMQTYIGDKKELIEAVNVISKLLNLEQQLVLEAYEKEVDRKKNIHDRVAKTVEDLSTITEQTNASVNTLSERTEAMLSMAQIGLRSAEEVQTRSMQGQQKIEEHQSEMNTILEHTRSITDETVRLKQLSEEIDGVAKMVKKISDSTHILGINAGIQAAHAKQHALGFRVIADEVKRLAEQTRDNVTEVSMLIEKTTSQVNRVATMNIEVHKLTQSGIETMYEIIEFFTRILSEIHMNKEQNKQIERELDFFVTHFGEINRAVSQLAHTTSGLTVILNEL